MQNGKQLARAIFENTLAAIDISAAIERCVEISAHEVRVGDFSVALDSIQNVQIVALGKAAHSMAAGLARIMPARISFGGIVIAPVAATNPLERMKYFVGGHPVPTEESQHAARAVLSLLNSCDQKTLVFFLLSGGGSALMELPLDSKQTLEDLQALHRVLVTCGASIEEMNTVRKHVSAVKGGRLAAAAGKAKQITLAISDVPAGKESALASGPTIPDPTTCADTHSILAKYSLSPKLPVRLSQWLGSGSVPETPKKSDASFANSCFHLLLGMHELFHAAHRVAESHGLEVLCDNETDDWPVKRAAEALLQQLEDWQRANPGKPVAVIADGEVSSAVTGDGTGGRNSAFVLACVERIAGKPITVLSAGTDGIDGNSPAAGVVADGESFARANSLGMDANDYFARSDAYSFFKKLNDAIEIGPTGNNLRDLRILISHPQNH